jgi:hypothetical protein
VLALGQTEMMKVIALDKTRIVKVIVDTGIVKAIAKR